MNNTFETIRFGKQFRKTVLERPVSLFGSLALTILVSTLIYAGGQNFIGYHLSQHISFSFGLIAGGCYIASQVFNYFTSNASGSSFLTLPSSHFEKWLTAVCICLLFTALFLLAFSILDYSLVELYQRGLDKNSTNYKVLSASVSTLPLNGQAATATYTIYLNASGAMLIGSLFFNKVGFIKVALLICGILIVAYWINFSFASMLFGVVDKALPFKYVLLPSGDKSGIILLPPEILGVVQTILLYILPAILWIISFVRLREKEF